MIQVFFLTSKEKRKGIDIIHYFFSLRMPSEAYGLEVTNEFAHSSQNFKITLRSKFSHHFYSLFYDHFFTCSNLVKR